MNSNASISLYMKLNMILDSLSDFRTFCEHVIIVESIEDESERSMLKWTVQKVKVNLKTLLGNTIINLETYIKLKKPLFTLSRTLSVVSSLYSCVLD